MTQEPMTPDYYYILGLRQDTNADVVKRMYRAKSLKHHPDKGGEHNDFLAIKEAFEDLSNASSRAQYDRNYPALRAEWDAYRASEQAQNKASASDPPEESSSNTPGIFAEPMKNMQEREENSQRERDEERRTSDETEHPQEQQATDKDAQPCGCLWPPSNKQRKPTGNSPEDKHRQSVYDSDHYHWSHGEDWTGVELSRDGVNWDASAADWAKTTSAEVDRRQLAYSKAKSARLRAERQRDREDYCLYERQQELERIARVKRGVEEARRREKQLEKETRARVAELLAQARSRR